MKQANTKVLIFLAIIPIAIFISAKKIEIYSPEKISYDPDIGYQQPNHQFVNHMMAPTDPKPEEGATPNEIYRKAMIAENRSEQERKKREGKTVEVKFDLEKAVASEKRAERAEEETRKIRKEKEKLAKQAEQATKESKAAIARVQVAEDRARMAKAQSFASEQAKNSALARTQLEMKRAKDAEEKALASENKAKDALNKAKQAEAKAVKEHKAKEAALKDVENAYNGAKIHQQKALQAEMKKEKAEQEAKAALGKVAAATLATKKEDVAKKSEYNANRQYPISYGIWPSVREESQEHHAKVYQAVERNFREAADEFDRAENMLKRKEMLAKAQEISNKIHNLKY